MDGWTDKSPWASCLSADSDSGGLGRGLRFSVSHKPPGDAAASGRGTVS